MTALSFLEFLELLKPLEPFEEAPAIAVAVSGGADSLSLCLLLKEWVEKKGGTLNALTIDHGLRPESLTEARQVGQWLRAYHIPHHILKWEGSKEEYGIQEKARAARYRLLKEWCFQNQVFHLFLAHQREDQEETLLMRFLKGSGIEGLSGMSQGVSTPFLRILRPFLTIEKARLIKTLEIKNQPWIEDPSNLSLKFERVRIRETLKNFNSHTLNLTAERMKRTRAYFERSLAKVFASYVTLNPLGYAFLKRKVLEEDKEIVLRLLMRLLLCIGGREFPLKYEKVEKIYDALKFFKEFTRKTGGGCCISYRKQEDSFFLCREAGRITESFWLEPGTSKKWDNRYIVSLSSQETVPLYVKKLASHPLLPAPLSLKEKKEVYAPLPSLWEGEKLVSVPLLGYGEDKGETLFCPNYSLTREFF